MVPLAKGDGNAGSPESKEEEAGIGIVQSERSLMLSLAWTGPRGEKQRELHNWRSLHFPSSAVLSPR